MPCANISLQSRSSSHDTRSVSLQTLWTMAVLDEAGSPLRFSRVLEQVKGVSQKSLTKTLRLLEQDGLVERTIFAEVPPRVEYVLTDLGREILGEIYPLWYWTVTNIGRLADARRPQE
jgi:DNA-binding HxlR family transcriptional regulator